AGRENLFEGALQQPLSTEPIVVIAEALDTVRRGELGLSGPRLGRAKVVEAEVRWNVWLIMAPKLGLGAGNVEPIRESHAPPAVILRNRVVLRKVESNQPNRRRARHCWDRPACITTAGASGDADS